MVHIIDYARGFEDLQRRALEIELRNHAPLFDLFQLHFTRGDLHVYLLVDLPVVEEIYLSEVTELFVYKLLVITYLLVLFHQFEVVGF